MQLSNRPNRWWSLGVMLLSLQLGACQEDKATTGGVDEFGPSPDDTTPADNSDRSTDNNSQDEFDPSVLCGASEEGLTDCNLEDPSNPDGTGGTGDGSGDGTSGTGDGSGDGTGGDCPEEGCPDGTDGTGDGSGDGSSGTGDGSGDGTGGDCPEEGCPDGTDGSGDGSGDGTGDGSGDGTSTICTNESFRPDLGLEADLLLVMDHSGSMKEYAPGTTETKWAQAKRVITQVAGEIQDQVGLGLVLYPLDDSCGTGRAVVDIAQNNAAAVSQALSLAGTPEGGTPTAETLRVARQYMSSHPSTRPRAVVLATDGAPNCNEDLDIRTCVCSQYTSCDHDAACLDDAEAIDAVEELAASSLPTFVIGIPGSELFSQVLDQMAAAGGTAIAGSHGYYETSSAETLEDALRAIGRRITTCRFELQFDPTAVAIGVTVNGVDIPRDTRRTNGWDYVGNNTIEFFGPACEALEADGTVVDVGYCAEVPN